jgi:hypothetical protein
VVHVGRVTAVYWATSPAVAVSLAEWADGLNDWPGLRESPRRRVRLILVDDAARFDSLSAGRLPEWGAGAAFPATNAILVKVGEDLRAARRVVRHELAHLALHETVGSVPRWFDEGYAVRAAGEWDLGDVMRVNWLVLRGRIPALTGLDRHLREANRMDAPAAYALASTAMLALERMGGREGLTPLMDALAERRSLDAAVRASLGLSLDQFEAKWQRELRERYGWLVLAGSFSAFWAVTGVLLVALWTRRRAYDRERRHKLEEAWRQAEKEWQESEKQRPVALDGYGTQG